MHTSARPVRVLIVSAAIGEGHDLPARVLTADLQAGDQPVDVEIADGLQEMGAVLRRVVAGGSATFLYRFTWFFDLQYWLLARFAPTRWLARSLLYLLGHRGLLALIARARPDVVVSTYPGTSEVLGELRRRGRLSVPVCSAITDLAALRYWAHPGVDLHLVTHPESIAEVREIAGARTQVAWATGLYSDSFLDARDRATARRELGVAPEAPLVVVSGGGWGVGDLEGATRAALEVAGAQVAVLCGRAERVRRQLAERFAAEPRVQVHDFTERMGDWLAAADALVHASAGLTVLEAYLRGCPTISYGWAISHIRANNRAFVRFGLARVARTPRELSTELRAVLAAPRPAPAAERFASRPKAATAVLSLAEEAHTAPAGAAVPQRVLVTGGAGFIGSHVVDKLLEHGYVPRVFDRVPSRWHPHGVETVLGDITDQEACARAVRGCDAVVHLAAVADVNDVDGDPMRAESVNARGTACVLEAARAAGVRRVVYASSVWVYSDCPEAQVDEDTPLPPPAHFYTATKLAGELYCRSYAQTHGFEHTILRFGIPYGPRAREAAVIPAFVRKALGGEALTVAGSGKQFRTFVYVEDLAEGVARALAPAAAGRVYNLARAEPVSIIEVAEAVRDTVGGTEIVHTPARAQDFGGKRVTCERARVELGWVADTPLSVGIARYVEWRRREGAAVAVPPARPRRLLPARLRRRRNLSVAWRRRVARPRLGTVAVAASLVVGGLSSDVPYSMVAWAIKARPTSAVATPLPRVGLLIDTSGSRVAPLAQELARRGVRASFAVTDFPPRRTLRAVARLGDEVLPRLSGSGPINWVSTGKRLRRARPRLGLPDHFLYVAPRDGFTLGAYLLAHSAGGSAIRGSLRLGPQSLVSELQRGTIAEVSLERSAQRWPVVLDSLVARLRATGLAAVPVGELMTS